jgi:hypothetical protein
MTARRPPKHVRRWLDLAALPGAPRASFWPDVPPGGILLPRVHASITASGSANTKGSWVAFTADTPALGWDGFILHLNPLNKRPFLLDIGIGGAGSEQVLVPNIGFSGGPTNNDIQFATLYPIRVPPNTRVAGRCQSTVGSSTVSAWIQPYIGGAWHQRLSLGKAVDYGTVTGDSGGTLIDPSTTPGVFSAWTQLSASLPDPISALIACARVDSTIESDNNYWYLELGVGASSSEQVIASMQFRSSIFYDCIEQGVLFMPASAKAGERLAARAYSGITTNADRQFDFSVIGFS